MSREIGGQPVSSHVQVTSGGRELGFVRRVLLNRYLQGSKELGVLGRKVELGIGPRRGAQLLAVNHIYLASLVEADRHLQDEKQIITGSAQACHDVGNSLGFGQRLIDGIAKFFNEAFEVAVEFQGSPEAAEGSSKNSFYDSPRNTVKTKGLSAIDCRHNSKYHDAVELLLSPQECEDKVLSRLEGILQHLFLHAKRLFHMLVGLLFLFLAIAGASVTFSEWNYYRKMPEVGSLRFSLIAAFTVLLFIFCLYSFVKARNIR